MTSAHGVPNQLCVSNTRRFAVLLLASLALLQANTTTAAIGLDGDYNFDGFVDDLDLSQWANSFGSTIDIFADGNGDGVVDIEDLYLWKANEGGAIAINSAAHSAPPTFRYNESSGALFIAPHGNPIYAFKVGAPASSVVDVTNSALPGAGAWDVRDISGSSVQGYDESMLLYATPVQSDHSLDALGDSIAKIADLQPGLNAGDFHHLSVGLFDGSTLSPSIVVVPEPHSAALLGLVLLAHRVRRFRT